MSLPPLMLDIEVVSAWDLLTDYQRGRLDLLHEKACVKDPTIVETAEEVCGLQAATGRIVSIGLLNPIANEGRGAGEVIFDGDPQIGTPDEHGIAWTTGSEKQMLQRFWRIVEGRQVVTYNGMEFDAPYLIARSLYCGVRPTQRIFPKWYERKFHLDLREELAAFRKMKAYSFEFTCQLFGIASPKTTMDGSMVGDRYRDGRVREIADYNINGDCRALAAMWRKLEPILPEWVK